MMLHIQGQLSLSRKIKSESWKKVEEEIKELLNQPEPIPDLQHLSEDERFEYLYMVIQLMKVDGQVFKSEIVFW